MSMSCCMCEPTEKAQSLGDDTHAVGTGARTAHLVWSFMSVGCKPGPSIGARTRTRADMNVRPRPFAQRTGKEKEGERGRERETEGWMLDATTHIHVCRVFCNGSSVGLDHAFGRWTELYARLSTATLRVRMTEERVQQNMAQMRKIQIAQVQFMVDLESTRQRHVQATNAAQEATNAACGHL